MSRSTRVSASDAQLRALSDDHIVDLLGAARRGLAQATGGDAARLESAVASLELEAARRGLELPGERERIPLGRALQRLRISHPSHPQTDWDDLLPRLDLAGLCAAYVAVDERTSLSERVAGLERIWFAVYEILHAEGARSARDLNGVDLPVNLQVRYSRVKAALEHTFRLLLDRPA